MIDKAEFAFYFLKWDTREISSTKQEALFLSTVSLSPMCDKQGEYLYLPNWDKRKIPFTKREALSLSTGSMSPMCDTLEFACYLLKWDTWVIFFNQKGSTVSINSVHVTKVIQTRGVPLPPQLRLGRNPLERKGRTISSNGVPVTNVWQLGGVPYMSPTETQEEFLQPKEKNYLSQ